MSAPQPWCPVCRLQVPTEGNTTVTDGQMGFYETFAAHGGCDGEGRRVKGADYGFVTDDGRTVPEWEFFARSVHVVDETRWVIVKGPGGLFGPEGDVPSTLNPCTHCGVWLASYGPPRLPYREGMDGSLMPLTGGSTPETIKAVEDSDPSRTSS